MESSAVEAKRVGRMPSPEFWDELTSKMSPRQVADLLYLADARVPETLERMMKDVLAARPSKPLAAMMQHLAAASGSKLEGYLHLQAGASLSLDPDMASLLDKQVGTLLGMSHGDREADSVKSEATTGSNN
eukprot:gene6187-6023_t